MEWGRWAAFGWNRKPFRMNSSSLLARLNSVFPLVTSFSSVHPDWQPQHLIKYNIITFALKSVFLWVGESGPIQGVISSDLHPRLPFTTKPQHFTLPLKCPPVSLLEGKCSFTASCSPSQAHFFLILSLCTAANLPHTPEQIAACLPLAFVSGL